MERRLLWVSEPSPELGIEASWLYLMTQADKRYTQTITHYPSDGGYRTRVLLLEEDAGRLTGLKEFWAFQDGLFETSDEALEFGEVVVQSDCDG